MAKLRILNRIDVPGSIRSPASIAFSRWYPDREENVLSIVRGGRRYLIYFDEACSGTVIKPDFENIHQHVSVCLNKICIEVRIENMPDDLGNFIIEDRGRLQGRPAEGYTSDEYNRLSTEYETLGKQINNELGDAINRMLSYLRIEKGQYWLKLLERNEDDLYSIIPPTAIVTCDGKNEEVRWCPPPDVLSMTVTVYEGITNLTREQWTDLSSFVSAERRPSLVREILARAEEFASKKESRAAIVEGVSALEIALERYFKTLKVIESEILKRVEPATLYQVYGKLAGC